MQYDIEGLRAVQAFLRQNQVERYCFFGVIDLLPAIFPEMVVATAIIRGTIIHLLGVDLWRSVSFDAQPSSNKLQFWAVESKVWKYSGRIAADHPGRTCFHPRDEGQSERSRASKAYTLAEQQCFANCCIEFNASDGQTNTLPAEPTAFFTSCSCLREHLLESERSPTNQLHGRYTS